MSFKENITAPNIILHHKNDGAMHDLHYHSAYEIYIAESDRTFLVAEQLIHLRERDVLLLKPDVIHCAVSGALLYSLIELPNGYFNKFFTDYGTDLVTACFEKNVIRVRESDFKLLLSCAEKMRDDNDNILALNQLLFILKNNMERKRYDETNSNSLASNIVDFITENYKTIDDLDTITSTFYISKGYLCSLFKEHTGTSIKKYVNLLKVQSSLELICQMNLSMEEVAQKSGFSTLTNFSKTFKIVMGIPPLKYRKENMKKQNMKSGMRKWVSKDYTSFG